MVGTEVGPVITVVDPPGAVVRDPGTTVGTVLGWLAVFQVAVVGQAVVAMVGEVVPYGVGPGTVEN